ncbi:hypothetical protein H0H92_005383 [Tricholoma furcatifolium]|nr:hypothetical protein H0H92_005383 [Tricholoma furcatifolium]
MVRPDQKDWVARTDLTEFTINTSISETTKFAPFELNGGYMPSMIKEICNDSVIPNGIRNFACQALINLAAAHDSIIEALVYLSTENLNLPKGRARKLCPKWVEPYKIETAQPEVSKYTLELPQALRERQLFLSFRVSKLRPYHATDDTMFPNHVTPEPYDFGAADDQEWFVDEIIGHRWNTDNQLEFENCRELEALDRYLELQGVKHPAGLSKKIADKYELQHCVFTQADTLKKREVSPLQQQPKQKKVHAERPARPAGSTSVAPFPYSKMAAEDLIDPQPMEEELAVVERQTPLRPRGYVQLPQIAVQWYVTGNMAVFAEGVEVSFPQDLPRRSEADALPVGPLTRYEIPVR